MHYLTVQNPNEKNSLKEVRNYSLKITELVEQTMDGGEMSFHPDGQT